MEEAANRDRRKSSREALEEIASIFSSDLSQLACINQQAGLIGFMSQA
jgi:hypothetical protein